MSWSLSRVVFVSSAKKTLNLNLNPLLSITAASESTAPPMSLDDIIPSLQPQEKKFVAKLDSELDKVRLFTGSGMYIRG